MANDTHNGPPAPPGTAIRQCADFLVTLLENERTAAAAVPEAKIKALLGYVAQQKRDAENNRTMYEANTASCAQKIQDLEAQIKVLQGQLRGETANTTAVSHTSGLEVPPAPEGTIDPRNIMKKTCPELPPSNPAASESFGIRFEKDTILFNGHWLNLWKELLSENSTDETYTNPMSSVDLERLLCTSIHVIKRNKEELNSLTRSIMAPTSNSELYGNPFISG